MAIAAIRFFSFPVYFAVRKPVDDRLQVNLATLARRRSGDMPRSDNVISIFTGPTLS